MIILSVQQQATVLLLNWMLIRRRGHGLQSAVAELVREVEKRRM